MKIERDMLVRVIDGITVIMPLDEDKWLSRIAEPNIFSKLVYLSPNDSVDNWEVITDEEKRRREEEQMAELEEDSPTTEN